MGIKKVNDIKISSQSYLISVLIVHGILWLIQCITIWNRNSWNIVVELSGVFPLFQGMIKALLKSKVKNEMKYVHMYLQICILNFEEGLN